MSQKKTAIIGGASPHLLLLPYDLWGLQADLVVGVNEYCLRSTCSWTVISDTYRLPQWSGWLEPRRAKGMKIAARRHNSLDPREARIPNRSADYWFPIVKKWESYGYKGKDGWGLDQGLSYASTTATTAIDLAAKLGATDLILAGVDLAGDYKADGAYYGANWWAIHVDGVNNWLGEFQKRTAVNIYKTNEKSPLALPYKTTDEVWAILSS